MTESGESMRGSQKWAKCHSLLNLSPTRIKSGPMRRVPKRCGMSKANSPNSVTGPQRRVSPVTGRTNWEWQYQQPSRRYTSRPRCSSCVYAVALVMHPFELTEIGADHRRHPRGARRGFEKGQEALGYERQEEKENARDQGNEARAHQAAPPAGTGAAPNAGRSASLAGLVNAVIIRLMTRSDIPISMLMPPTVRTSQ